MAKKLEKEDASRKRIVKKKIYIYPEKTYKRLKKCKKKSKLVKMTLEGSTTEEDKLITTYTKDDIKAYKPKANGGEDLNTDQPFIIKKRRSHRIQSSLKDTSKGEGHV